MVVILGSLIIAALVVFLIRKRSILSLTKNSVLAGLTWLLLIISYHLALSATVGNKISNSSPSSWKEVNGVMVDTNVSISDFPSKVTITTNSIPINSISVEPHTIGSFFLGTGVVGGSRYYFFYRESEIYKGEYQLDKVKCEDASIDFTSKIPAMHIIQTKGSWFEWYGLIVVNQKRILFTLPYYAQVKKYDLNID